MEKPILKVTTFGEFSISVSDSQAEASCIISDNSSRSKKLPALLQYLILQRNRAVPVNELYTALRQNGEVGDFSANALKILIHRARLELNKLDCYTGKELILNRQGAYQWNPDIPIEVDCETFDTLFVDSRKVFGDEQLDIMLKAIALYAGFFLPKSVSYYWAAPLYEHYHLRFTRLVLESSAMLDKHEEDFRLLELLNRVLKISPFIETLHIHYIRALTRTGQHDKALRHYTITAEKFYMQYGKAPSEQLLSLYKSINGDMRGYESDVNAVFRDMLKPVNPNGAFSCDLSVFREICQLKLRESIRSGIVSQIALITVSNAEGEHPGDKVMAQLPEAIGSSLRVSDVFSQYSSRQYLVLMPAAGFENSKSIIERIERRFKTLMPRSGAVIQYSLMQLDASVAARLNLNTELPAAQ